MRVRVRGERCAGEGGGGGSTHVDASLLADVDGVCVRMYVYVRMYARLLANVDGELYVLKVCSLTVGEEEVDKLVDGVQ